jgi:ribosomal protein L7/L12
MKTTPELAVACRALRARGFSDEDLMTFFRAEKCSKIDSIAVLREVLDLSLAEGKALVHLSKAWGDVRERDDAFHDALHEAMMDVVNEELGPVRRRS